MGYGPGIPCDPPRNKHRWYAIDNAGRPMHAREYGDVCRHCGIKRTHDGWRDRIGNWHTGPIPRCGEFIR